MTDSEDIYFDRKKKCFVGISSLILKNLRETYVDRDVEIELKKMALWLLSEKGKKRKGTFGFIINWLNKAQPSYRNPPAPIEGTVLGKMYQNYLKELWANREHLLDLNTKT